LIALMIDIIASLPHSLIRIVYSTTIFSPQSMYCHLVSIIPRYVSFFGKGLKDNLSENLNVLSNDNLQ